MFYSADKLSSVLNSRAQGAWMKLRLLRYPALTGAA